MLFYWCASLKDSHTFARCEKWKQWTSTMVTNDYNCPLLSLTPSYSVKKSCFNLYISATPPMFLWNAKVHVEWNVRTLKLINLHFSMPGQTYFIVTFIVWIESFFCISTGLWLSNNRVFLFILWLLVSAVHGGKIKLLLNYLLGKKQLIMNQICIKDDQIQNSLHIWYRSGYVLNQKHAYILNQVVAVAQCVCARVCIRM